MNVPTGRLRSSKHQSHVWTNSRTKWPQLFEITYPECLRTSMIDDFVEPAVQLRKKYRAKNCFSSHSFSHSHQSSTLPLGRTVGRYSAKSNHPLLFFFCWANCCCSFLPPDGGISSILKAPPPPKKDRRKRGKLTNPIFLDWHCGCGKNGGKRENKVCQMCSEFPFEFTVFR